MSRERKCGVFIQWNNTHRKEWSPAVCDNMGGRRKDYAEWNKSDRIRQIVYVITYM